VYLNLLDPAFFGVFGGCSEQYGEEDESFE